MLLFLPVFSMPLFLAEIAAKRGFIISSTSPDPIGYRLMNRNPILECLANQMNHDQERTAEKTTGLGLRDEIISVLTENEFEWPQQNNITKEQWIIYMKKTPTFYRQKVKNPSEMHTYEGILLDLATKHLKKRIVLIPFLEGDQEEIFQKYNSMQSNSKCSYYLLCCRKASIENFYMSIFPDWEKISQIVWQIHNHRRKSFSF